MRRWLLSACAVLLAGFALSTGQGHAQTVLISEFVASNDGCLFDEDGDSSDWIELYNPETVPVNLEGWGLTDSQGKPQKWVFPAVTIQPNAYMIVFASDKDRRDPTKPLHTSYKLDAQGEYVGLFRPDLSLSCEYGPSYPPQQTDVSYGMGYDGATVPVLTAPTAAKAVVPPNNNWGLNWTQTSFNDSSWKSGQTGLGFERSSGYESLIGLNVLSEMYNVSGTAYLRIPFTYDGSPAEQLNLRMKYDDGFVAYLNGVKVASKNAPASLGYRSNATRINEDSLALQWEYFDITAYKSYLVSGQNVLAVHGLNAGTTSSDFLIVPEIIRFVGTGIQPDVIRFFSVPTPGGPNGTGSADQGPAISDIAHTPNQPLPGENLTVTARVMLTTAPVATVTLTWRMDYGGTSTITMLDDGMHGDGVPADGVFGAVIPGAGFTAGSMVRYYITAADTVSHTSRSPLFVGPTAPEYYGTVVLDPALASALPILHWFVQNPSAAATESGTQSSCFYRGVFYDNIFTRLRGQTSMSWPKQHYKFDMSAGFYFQVDDEKPPVEEFNLQSTYSDKAYIRQVLGWETYANAGVAGCYAFPVRVQQNAAFHSVAIIVEQPDETMLNRNGLDGDGALYKMYNDCTSATVNVEKKTRETEDNSDLQALVTGVNQYNEPLFTYLCDNVDIWATINYIAATTIMHDNDHVAKNYYVYRDSDKTGEWTMLPWDKDLTFGRNFTLEGGVLNDTIWASADPYSHPLFGDIAHQKCDNLYNKFIDAMHRTPVIRTMYLRRLRTLMDDLIQPPGTPAAELKFEKRCEELYNLMAPDVILDRAKWAYQYGYNQSFLTGVNILKSAYLSIRRNHLYNTHSGPGRLIPDRQVPQPDIVFGAVDRSPASGNKEEEYVEIANPNTTAVDISGWKLTGDVQYTFRPGTVLPPNGSLYCVRDVKAFRARATWPKGGQGLFVQGDFDGHLAVPLEPVYLVRPDESVAATLYYTVSDAVEALEIAAGFETPSVERRAILDVLPEETQDGLVTLDDAVSIYQKAMGM